MTVEIYNGYQYCSGTKWHYTLLQAHVIAPLSRVSGKTGERHKKVFHFLNFNASWMISYVCLLVAIRRVDLEGTEIILLTKKENLK